MALLVRPLVSTAEREILLALATWVPISPIDAVNWSAAAATCSALLSAWAAAADTFCDRALTSSAEDAML